GHDVRAVVPVAQGVEATFPAGQALDDDPGVLVDEDRHSAQASRPLLASSTARPAASSMVAAGTSPSFGLAARIARPSSALVPSRRTTTGTFTSIVPNPSRMPWATRWQRVFPPTMLMSTDLRLGSPVLASR